MSIIDNKALAVSTTPVISTKKVTSAVATPAPAVKTNQNGLTDAQVKAGYSTIPGAYNPVTGQLNNQSTTTISNGNKISQVPGIQNTTNQFATGGVTTDPASGISTTANGAAYTPYASSKPTTAPANGITTAGGYVGETYYAPGSTLPPDGKGGFLSTTETSPTSDRILKSLSDQKAQADSLTAQMISNIEGQYATYQRQQEEINSGNNAASQGGLFRSGAAQGDAYAQNTQNYQIQQGVSALADLATKKQTAILQAQQAGQANDFKLQDSINQELANIATDQAAAGKKLSETLSAAQAKQQQATRDNTVANLYAQGVTDVHSMLNYLNYDQKGKLIGDFTAEEINNSLKNIIPPGLDDLVKTLRGVGAPSEIVQKVLSSSNLNDAYINAGPWAQAGGTGMIGEYNFYKAQALANGQVPVDFNTYQNMDANRKAKVAAAANGSGYNPGVLTKIQQIAGQFDNEQSVKSYQTVAEGKSFLDSIPNDTKNPSDQQGVIYAFAKVMDPNSVVREGEYNTVQKYAQSWASTFGFNASRIFSNSPFLSSEAIKNMKATIKSKVDASKKSYDNIYNEYGRRINKISGGKDGTDFITDYSKGYGQTGDNVIESEDQAKQDVINYGQGVPSLQETIKKMIDQSIPYLTIKSTLGI